MDLTYMPGELDYKVIKKDDSKIKRDHDSVDDFEHLDPDSPAEMKQNSVSPFNTDTIISGSEIQTEKMSSSNDHLTHPYTTHGDSNLHVGLEDSSTKQFDSVGILPSSDPALKVDTSATDDFDLNVVAQSDLLHSETTRSGNTQKEEIRDSSDSAKTLNSFFIEAEVINNKDGIGNENALLNFEEKSKDSGKNTTSESFPSVVVVENKEFNSGPLVDDLISGKEVSMKETDALSQYDIKVEKKESDQLTDGNFMEQNHDNLSKIESDNLDPFAPELTTPQSHPDTSESKIPKSGLPSFESEKDAETHYVNGDKNNAEEPKDGPFIEFSLDKPYIAICPSKPEAEENPTPPKDSHQKKASVSDLDDIIGPEDVFKRIGLDAWFTPDRLHPKVEALVYWRDPKKSGVVFGGVMAILLSLCYMSLISVVAYSSLLALLATISFRIYKNILQAVQKTSEGHPFKEFLDLELSLPQEKMREIVDTAVVHVNASIVELRRLFLVEDLIDSIKFGVCLWCLTYVGAIFNGMTLVILAFVALFTVPKIYENNKASIDQYIEMGRSKVAEITTKVKAAVPIGKKEEKDKEQ